MFFAAWSIRVVVMSKDTTYLYVEIEDDTTTNLFNPTYKETKKKGRNLSFIFLLQHLNVQLIDNDICHAF